LAGIPEMGRPAGGHSAGGSLEEVPCGGAPMLDAELARNDEIQKKAGYHHENLRNAIIEAVAQLIGEGRSAQFQLKDVAALVGTSQPATSV